MKKIAYVGIDYHQNSVSLAVVLEGEKDVHETMRLANEDKRIKKFFKRYAEKFEIKACYEASSSGYAFQRKMNGWGYKCDVIAPSLIPKKAGNRRKNDFRDAIDLGKNYANGELSIVHPPTEEEEGVRTLVRCRMTLKDYAKRVKLQINSLLLGHGIKYARGAKWTKKHRKWVCEQQLPDEHMQRVLESHLKHLSYLEAEVEAFDKQIEEIARSDIYEPSVKKLRAFKGLGTLAAMLLITEITDFRRFASPTGLMAYLGLIPSEDSSGDVRRGGPITKAGNKRCRTQLIEAAQHYVRSPKVSKNMASNLAQVDTETAGRAIKCMHRLHERYWKLTMKGKLRPVAITAIAREFVGFIWAVMQPQELLVNK